LNPTAKKFGYPDTLVKRYEHWLLLVRPAQPTLGSLVLLCTDDAHRFGDISTEAVTELKRATADLETALSGLFEYDKVNYLMLMMVDPDVHFHVLPRYEQDRSYGGIEFSDSAWPGPPDITHANEFPDPVKSQLIADLKAKLG
jgi:diadenosine tetraphosphate (Ap4A) HIT family hydrolase